MPPSTNPNLIFLLISYVSLLSHGICVSLSALLRRQKHSDLRYDEAGSVDEIKRSMIFPRERHLIQWKPWWRWHYMRTSLDLHAIAFPRAGDVLIVPRIRRGGANFIFLLSHSISLPPLPLMASVSVSLPALPRWRQHSEPGRDGAGFVVGIERSMIFPRERHQIWWEPWGRWCYVRTSVDLHAVAFQVQCCFLLSLKFDEEVLVSFLYLFALSLSLLLSISWNLYPFLCRNYRDVGKL